MTGTYFSECFTCSKLSYCSQVDISKILKGYVCPLFTVVEEPVIQARSEMVKTYETIPAIRALRKKSKDSEEEELTEMSIETPAPGTPYSERKKQLEVFAFMDVRLLGAKKYKGPDGQPVLDWDETLQVDRKAESIEKVLQFELDNNIIVPDAATPHPTQGAQQMTQPFNPNGASAPQNMPSGQVSPPPLPMPTTYGPPGYNQPSPTPGFLPPGAPPTAPYGAAPAPVAPPPVATPQQAAGQDSPPQGSKKKKGAAAAPPPPPPPPTNFQPPAPPTVAPGLFSQTGQSFPPAPVGWPQTAPSMGGQPPAVTAQAPQAMPQQPSTDFSPVLSLIHQVGEAVNGLNGVQTEQMKQLQSTIAELRNLMLVQITALHHIYLGQPNLQQSIQNAKNAGNDLQDANKFFTYMQPFLPR